MTLLWHYLINQFLNGTKKSFRKAVKLSRFHDTHLFQRMTDNPGDAQYILCYNRYHDYHLALMDAYNIWVSKGGHQKGDTLNLDQLLALLPGKINKADHKIQDVYEKGTPRYAQLFPNSHYPFNSGAKELRIDALKALSLEIGSELALAAAKTIVDDAYHALTTAKDTQEESKESKDDGSEALEVARVDAMTCQYKNLGIMMDKFPSEPKMIENLFDVDTLNHPEQCIWKGHLDPKEIHPTLIHTFEAGDMMRLKSTGHGDILAFLATTPGGTDSAEINVAAEHEKIFDVAQFGVDDYATHRYLTIINKSDTLETRFLLELY
jgi:hypothetical protein